MTAPRAKIAVFRPLPVNWDDLAPYGEVLRPASETPLTGKAAAQHMAPADALLITPMDPITAEMLEQAPHLRWISNIGAGLDHVDLAACARRGVRVANAPQATVEPTADLAFALMLAAARRVLAADARVRMGAWNVAEPPPWGFDLHHRTLGIIGMGRIGRAIARRAQGFSMRIVYHNRQPIAAEADASGGAEWRSLDDLLAEADFVVVQAPLTDETRHLIGAREFKLMKPTAVLVNTGRGGIVDEIALSDALNTGVIAGAGLDVFEEEPTRNERLLHARNLVTTPHIGTATLASRKAMLDEALANLKGFLSAA